MTTKTEPRWPYVEQSADPFVHRGAVLPPHIREALDNFARYGMVPGSFLQSVLANDLQGAVARADFDNLEALPAIVSYVYNALPADCWGSADAVREHAERWFPQWLIQRNETIDQLHAAIAKIREKLQDIVETEGEDAARCCCQARLRRIPKRSTTIVVVYDYEYFSPLGEALMEVWKLASVV